MPSTFQIVSRYWAKHLGFAEGALFDEQFKVVSHGGELTNYNGVVALARGQRIVASTPPDRIDLKDLLAGIVDPSLSAVHMVLQPVASRVIGPAFIGYADEVREIASEAVSLGATHVAAVDALRFSCLPEEWEHGGTDVTSCPASGVFERGRLVALAGYEIWGGAIAHISVLAHPQFRARGFGKCAVAHIARRAMGAGLVPQYRTLESNLPSLRIARDLGFVHYATSVAFRL